MNSFNNLIRLNYLLQKSKTNPLNTGIKSLSSQYNLSKFTGFSLNLSRDLPFYLSLTKKPINLLFSLDQFFFEFSKKTYQQQKTGNFNQQLKEKKKFILFYGHLNRNYLTNLFYTAKKHKGYFSKNLLCLLERRLDVVLYRSGLTPTMWESRQLILHRKVLVNNNLVDFPAFLLNPGDLISIESKTRDKLRSELILLLKALFKKSQSAGKFQIQSSSSLLNDLTEPKSHDTKSTHYDSIHQNFQSKEICRILVGLISTRFKLRSFYNLKFFLNHKKSAPINVDEKSKTFLTFIKWKSFSIKPVTKLHFSKKQSLNKNRKNLLHKNLGMSSIILYANAGCLQQKPLLWNNSSFDSKQQKMVILKNNKTSHKDKSSRRPFLFLTKWDRAQKDSKNLKVKKQTTAEIWSLKKQNKASRKSLFLFLKNLEKSGNFTSFVKSKINKILSKNIFFRKKPEFSYLTFRAVKPLHIEISYKLLTMIYLYSPQRLNFPFSINLDVIGRSVS